MTYKHSYLKETWSRGSKLFQFVKDYFRHDDTFLDVMCGYSPLGQFVVESDCKIIGFDIFDGAIQTLKKKIPNGDWKCSSFEDVPKTLSYDVLLLLGISNEHDNYALESWLEKELEKKTIRLIVMEVAGKKSKTKMTTSYEIIDQQASRFNAYNNLLEITKDNGFKVDFATHYDAEISYGNERYIVILERKQNEKSNRDR